MELRKYFTRLPETRTASATDQSIPVGEVNYVLVPESPMAKPKEKTEKRHFPYHKVHYHQPPLKKDTNRRLAVLAVLLATGVSLTLIGGSLFARLGRPKSEEKPLQTAQSSSKVIPNSAKAPEVPPPLPPLDREPPKFVEKNESAPKLMPPPSSPAPFADLTIPAMPMQKIDVPAEPPVAAPPLIGIWQPYRVFASTYGETPMLYNWKMLKWASALAVAVTITPVAFAQDDKVLEALKEMKKDMAANFKAVADDIGKIRQELAILQPIVVGHAKDLEKATNRLENLEKQVAQLRSDLDAVKGKNIALYQADKTQLDNMKDKLDQIEKSLSGNGNKTVVQSSPTLGRVLLKNRYSERLWFVVNGQNYEVMPNTDMLIDNLAPGTLTYEVWSPTYGRRVASQGTLNSNKTFTLLATFPQ